MTSVIALWVGLCCAAKDFSDIDGDRAAGRRTWPVLIGGRRASRILACLAVGGAGATIGAARVAAVPALPAFVIAGGSMRAVVPLGTPLSPGDTVFVGERWF